MVNQKMVLKNIFKVNLVYLIKIHVSYEINNKILI